MDKRIEKIKNIRIPYPEEVGIGSIDEALSYPKKNYVTVEEVFFWGVMKGEEMGKRQEKTWILDRMSKFMDRILRGEYIDN